jgi:hypothetical protein
VHRVLFTATAVTATVTTGAAGLVPAPRPLGMGKPAAP